MSREIIVAEYGFDADHILTDETLATEDTSAREVRPAVPDDANTGDLNPVPLGTPSANSDLDIIARSTSRFGVKDHADTIYRGKCPACIVSTPILLDTQTAANARPSRPKLLSLASGALLIIWRYGTGAGADSATAVKWMTWSPSSTGGTFSAVSTLTINASISSLYGVDAVQMPSGEIVMMVLTFNANAYAIELTRFVSSSDIAGSISFKQLPAEINTVGNIGLVRVNHAMEVLENGRIALLIKDENVLWRTFSDDRGESWANPKIAGQFTPSGMLESASSSARGGVAIARTKNGSLLAVTSCLPGGFTSAGNWTQSGTAYALRPLVSDDGDNWSDMITASKATDGVSSITSQAAGMLPEGVNEGAVAISSDGLPKIFGVLHGDSGGTITSDYFDDIIMLSLRKPIITSQDVGKALTGDQAYSIQSTSATYVATGSDAFDGVWYDDQGVIRLQRATGSTGPAGILHRISILRSGSNGGASGNLQSTPDYNGVRYVDVVEHRGSLVAVWAFEDTTNTQYALSIGWLNEFNELYESPPRIDSAAALKLGRIYRQGIGPDRDPAGAGWTLSGAGTNALETIQSGGTGGRKLTCTAVQTAYYNYPSLEGTAGQSAMVRGCVRVNSGGSAIADDIAIQIKQQSGAGFETFFGLRFLSGEIHVIDRLPDTSIGSLTSLGSARLEFAVRFSAFNTVASVAVKPVFLNSDFEEWRFVTLSGGGALNIQATTTGEYIRYGTLVAGGTPSSTWHGVWYTRADGTFNYSALEANTYTTYPAAEFNTTDDRDVPGYDDGFRHGSRPPVTTPWPFYLRHGVLARWQGGYSQPGDLWRMQGRFEADVTRVCKMPVSNLFQSGDDGVATPIVWDSGYSATSVPRPRFFMESVALFRCNAYSFKFQAHTANSWTSPLVNIDVGPNSDIQRADIIINSGSFTEDGDSDILRVTSQSNAFAPHAFRSTERQSWYVYSFDLDKAAKIIDNDGNRLFLSRALLGSSADAIAIYSDRFAFDLQTSITSLAAAGLRYARILFAAQDLPEGKHQLGYALAGRRFSLASPHPDWGWSMGADAKPTISEMSSNYLDVVKHADAPRRFRMAFTGLRDRADAIPGELQPPATTHDFRQYLEFLEALNWGQSVVALIPDYSDLRAFASDDYLHTSEVYPVRMLGPFQASQAAYEACRTGDGMTKAIMDLAELEFIEVL